MVGGVLADCAEGSAPGAEDGWAGALALHIGSDRLFAKTV